jgi:hypothetical protein
LREQNDRIEQAWMTARLNAYAPPKSDKFIKLKDILITADGLAQALPRRQTPDEQLAIARSWMASRRR